MKWKKLLRMRKFKMEQLIYKNGCWACKRAIEDPEQEYTCPKEKQHLKEYQKQQSKYY
jgi:hypothetical protein